MLPHLAPLAPEKPGHHLGNDNRVLLIARRPNSLYEPVSQFFSEPKSPWAHYPKLAGRGAEIKDIVAPLEATWALHVGTAKLKIGEDATQDVSAALGHLTNMQDIVNA